MPDKPLTVLTYAASASLAAVALVYFFNPNYVFDGDSSSLAGNRKKTIVGLFNPANDCFINCILQALAGLGDLRLYLIREIHRRELGGPDVYASVPRVDANGKAVKADKLLSLQSGEVTQGLKEMIDRLNERPIYKKTISANAFVRVLEHAFQTRIAKSQQDAQELLQIVAERLSEEYHAGREARMRFHKSFGKGEGDAHKMLSADDSVDAGKSPQDSTKAENNIDELEEDDADGLPEDEEGFPLEGQTEAINECQHCHFIPKANPTSFVMLNLMVPQKSSSTLNDCFDAHFKTEYVDDYKCDKCRLEHAVEAFTKDLERAKSEEGKASIESKIEKLRKALEEDPEKVPEGVNLPDSKFAPKRKIARHIEITRFPRVLVIHLSRSIFDPYSSSTKNMCKLTFPERFPVGGILKRRNYKLLGVVAHKGTHNNGHYETFRRQHFYAPFSTPHLGNGSGPYSVSPNRSSINTAEAPPTPSITIQTTAPSTPSPSTADNSSLSAQSTSPSSTKSHSPPSTRPSSGSAPDATETESPAKKPSTEEHSPPLDADSTLGKTSLDSKCERGVTLNRKAPPIANATTHFKRRKRPADRWWRISDDKIKECKTSEVMGMQKGAYMLFYEMERNGNDEGSR